MKNIFTYSKFINNIKYKYNNNINIGQYIVERLLYSNIYLGFSYDKDKYTPFFNICSKNQNFDIIFKNKLEDIACNTVFYNSYKNKTGIIFISSYYNLNTIIKNIKENKKKSSTIIFSFYNNYNDINNSIIKQTFILNKYKNTPIILEDVIQKSENSHKNLQLLYVNNNILKKKLDFK